MRRTSVCKHYFLPRFMLFYILHLKWYRNIGQNKVLLGIGGGHYVPRHMDIVLWVANIIRCYFSEFRTYIYKISYFRKYGVWVGHLLSGYTLPMEDQGQVKGEETVQAVGGTWKQAIKVSFETTTQAFPGGQVLAHLDHKLVRSFLLIFDVSELNLMNILLLIPSLIINLAFDIYI